MEKNNSSVTHACAWTEIANYCDNTIKFFILYIDSHYRKRFDQSQSSLYLDRHAYKATWWVVWFGSSASIAYNTQIFLALAFDAKVWV